MSNDYTSLVSKVWNYAYVLRDQGIGYGDYVEQTTFLLFLKMDQERSELLGRPPSSLSNGAGNGSHPWRATNWNCNIVTRWRTCPRNRV